MNEKQNRMVAHLKMSDRRFKIVYLIPHDETEFNNVSPFCWYGMGLLNVMNLVRFSIEMPADIREPFTEKKYIFLPRLLRSIHLNILPVEKNIIDQVHNILDGYIFRVILTNNQEMATIIDKFIKRSKYPYLHISATPGAERLEISKVTKVVLVNKLKEIATTVSVEYADQLWIRELKKLTENKKIEKPVKISYSKGMHNTVAPNEAAMEYFGYSPKKSKQLVAGPGNGAEFVDRIIKGTNIIDKIRTEYTKGLPRSIINYKYIVCVPSVYWDFYDNFYRDFLKKNPPSEERDALKLFFKSLKNPNGYYEISGTPEDLKRIIQNDVSRGCMLLRAQEFRGFTTAMTALSVSTFAPVIRLEPKISNIRGEIKLFAETARHGIGTHYDFKQSKMLGKLQNKMFDMVDRKFLNLLAEAKNFPHIQGIKLASDLPLELIKIGGYPLGLGFDVSRLPTMPGNLLLAGCLDKPITITKAAFNEILIIRSFDSQDPIRGILEEQLRKIFEESSGIDKIKIVDVSSEQDFIEALNTYQGAMFIFDGHGKNNNKHGYGSIIVGGHEIDLWSLRHRCKMPPIVIFSACDTYPIDGGHGSIANAALGLGAKSVLATFLPVNAVLAANFIARIILRVFVFLPMLLETKKIVTWRDIVSGMLRMTYATEISIKFLRKTKCKISIDEINWLQLKANEDINSLNNNWHENIVTRLAGLAGMPQADVLKIIDTWGMVDALKYVQLGAPENIIIVKNDVSEIFDFYK